MDEQTQDELQATKLSFYKLQDNFNHNLLVIKQLQQQNDKLQTENEHIREQYHTELDSLYVQMQELKNQNKKLNIMVRTQVEKVRALCQEQTQHIIQMMNEKMMEEKKHQAKKFMKQHKQIQQQAEKYQQKLIQYTQQNNKLLQTIKTLRMEKQSIQAQLSHLLAQKQSNTNKLIIHEKQLENIRKANQQWQSILKDKIKQANKDKQKLQEQVSQMKLSYKLKLKTVKEQAAKKIQEIQGGKQKSIRLLTQQAKQIKYRYDATVQQTQKLRMENKNLQKQISRLEQQVKLLSKQASSQKQLQYTKKMYEQQKLQLKNQLRMTQSQRNQLKQQLKQVNQRRQEVQKAVQRLKTALLSAKKQIGDQQKKNRKLQKQLKQLKNQTKRIAQATNMNYRPIPNQDAVNQIMNNVPVKDQNIQYSKYFSQDMGPADQMFFMQNSVPRSPKNMTHYQQNQNNQVSTANHQLMKKVGQLQVETDQYKNIIKTMTQQMQKAKSTFLDQLSFKQQQIKLCRDQINLLRQKINQRQQQLLFLNSIKQQNQQKSNTIKNMSQKYASVQKQLQASRLKMDEYQNKLKQYAEKQKQTLQQLQDVQRQKNILDQINQQLRGEIHKYKNRIKIYNQDQQEEEQQEFQEIMNNNSDNSEEYIGRSQLSEVQMKKTEKKNRNKGNKSRSKSKSRSRSRSNPRLKPGGNTYNNSNNYNESRSQLLQASKTSIKLKDLVIRKKQLEMQGKKMQMQIKQPNSLKNIQRVGTNSQKQILENIKRKSKSKQKKLADRLKNIDYNALMGRNTHNQNQHQHL